MSALSMAGIAGAVLVLALAPGPLAAETTRPQPPPPRKVLYDPDQATCQPAHVERSFAAQLRPWADQPPPVQARLRALQADMLRGSLRRCVDRGLLTPAQAEGLEQRLLASPPAATPQAAPPSGQRP